VAATLDLTAEFSEAAPLLETTYLNIPILDLTAPTEAQLRRAAEFIEHESRLGIVYVHCKIGYSRSVAVVGAYLLHSRQARSVEEAVAMLRRVRPSIVVRPEIWRALEQFQTVQNRAAIARSK
jgi:protein-tyrosine phosphatase